MPVGDSLFLKLSDSNYVDWKYQMEAYLTTKYLWDIVNGTEEKPAGSASMKAVKAWIKWQRLARAEIILRVEPGQHLHTHFDDPKVIWENLEKVHRA
jgi:Domain of unknown function (DUF4219)